MALSKKVKIGLGVGALVLLSGGAFLLLNKKISPAEKLAKDAFDPTTAIGQEFKTFYTNLGQYNAESIQEGINYHLNPANNSPFLPLYLAKEGWGANEVVS